MLSSDPIHSQENHKDRQPLKTVRVILVEDHALVRAGVSELLAKLGWVKVVAETGNGREAVQLIKIHRPDVVLMDIGMSDMNGLEATARTHKISRDIRVIILSMHDSEEYVLQALRYGATGYLLKDAYVSELETAIKAVVRGETYLSPRVSRYVISDYVRRVGNTPGKLSKLTPRHREVLQLIAEGCTTKEVAQKLDISTKTAEVLRQQLMDRLEIHNVAGLVRYAIQIGVVILEQTFDSIPGSGRSYHCRRLRTAKYNHT